MHPLEERIGYKFRNSLLLAEALTHPSLGHETQQVHFDNQRLEYLGDAVLQLLFSDHLYRRFPEAAEGQLTKNRARLVSGETLAVYAKRVGLGEHLMMGKGDESNGGRLRSSTLADAFEALVGAMFLDGGFDSARAFVLAQAREQLATVHQQPPLEINPKGQLQEILQALPLARRGCRAAQPDLQHPLAHGSRPRADVHGVRELEQPDAWQRRGRQQATGGERRRHRRVAFPPLAGGYHRCSRSGLSRRFGGRVASWSPPFQRRERLFEPLPSSALSDCLRWVESSKTEARRAPRTAISSLTVRNSIARAESTYSQGELSSPQRNASQVIPNHSPRHQTQSDPPPRVEWEA